jgi:hypothetical protein
MPQQDSDRVHARKALTVAIACRWISANSSSASASPARAPPPPPIDAPCTQRLRHGDPMHAQERLTAAPHRRQQRRGGGLDQGALQRRQGTPQLMRHLHAHRIISVINSRTWPPLATTAAGASIRAHREARLHLRQSISRVNLESQSHHSLRSPARRHMLRTSQVPTTSINTSQQQQLAWKQHTDRGWLSTPQNRYVAGGSRTDRPPAT